MLNLLSLSCWVCVSQVLFLQDNAVPYQLKNGSVLLAGTCGSSSSTIPGSDNEQIDLFIAAPGRFFGPFRQITGRGFGGSLWMEDEPGEGELQGTILYAERCACCRLAFAAAYCSS